MTFLNPLFLLFLLLIPLMIFFYFLNRKKQHSKINFSYSFINLSSIKSSLFHLLFLMKLLTTVLIIIALARPQDTVVSSDILKKEGIDIMIAMDVSSSMLAEDFKPNRLEAAKSLAIEFIKRRKNDRIGLVIYSGESFTQCPLTTDHDILINLMNNVETGLINDGTAIGLGLANCVNRLKESKVESKIIILLTDGENNTGFIDPITAAVIAKDSSIKTYTIGVGSYGTAPYPTQDMFGRSIYVDVPAKIDENMLRAVADTTGGMYFRADNNSKLASIYQEIESLEKSEIEEIKYYNVTEKYSSFCLLALVIFLIEFILNYTYFKKIV